MQIRNSLAQLQHHKTKVLLRGQPHLINSRLVNQLHHQPTLMLFHINIKRLMTNNIRMFQLSQTMKPLFELPKMVLFHFEALDRKLLPISFFQTTVNHSV